MTLLSIDIFSGNYNKSMSAKFISGNKLLKTIKYFDEGTHRIDFDINLPTKFYISVDGKDNNTDTVLDKNGNVKKDKFLRLDNILLDKKPINSNALYKICEIRTVGNQIINSNYIGFNGIVKIDLDYSDSLIAHLTINNMLG